MTLLRRAPREVYRVYSEEEFFDGGAGMHLLAPATASGAGERRLRRLAGAAMLAGAVGTMGGAVMLAGSRPARGSGRRAGNGDAHALARARLATRAQAQRTPNPAVGGSDAAISPATAARARFGGRTRAGHTVLAADASHRARIERRPRAEYAERGGHGQDAQGDATTVMFDAASDSAPAPTVASDGAPTPVPAVAGSSSPSVTDTDQSSRAPTAERAEFGFER